MKKKFQNWEGITVERISEEKRDQSVMLKTLRRYYSKVARKVAAESYREDHHGCRM